MQNRIQNELTISEFEKDWNLDKILLIGRKYSYLQIVKALNFAFGLLIVLWLPLNRSMFNYVMGFWILTWLMEGNFINRFKNNQLRRSQVIVLLFPIFFYLLHLLSYFYSNNKAVAGFDLEVKLPLLLFPIVFLGLNHLYFDYRKAFLHVFILGNLLASFICLGHAFYESISIVDGSIVFETAVHKGMNHLGFFNLINHRFSYFSYAHFSILHHPSYFAMFLNFGIIVCYYLYRMADSQLNKLIYFGTTLFFSLMVYMVASRAGLLTLVFLFLSISIIEIILSHRVLAIILTIIFLGILIKVISKSQLEENFLTIVSKFTSLSDPAEKKDDRLILWECAIDAAKKSPWLGVGIGDIKEELVKQYEKHNYLVGIQKQLNVHNQFLESYLAGGIILLGWLFCMLVYSLYYAITRKRYIFGSLILIIALNIAFETMLNVTTGVVFIVFFYCLLVVLDFKQLTLKQAIKKIRQS